MQVDEKHLIIINSILTKYPYTFFAFGSRVKGDNRYFSDLDLCFIEDIPSNLRSKLEEEFEESDLPYKIDLVNWQDCTQEFRDIISTDMICLQGDAKLIIYKSIR